MIKFCECGLPIINGICKKCKGKTIEFGKKERKEKIKKYSGRSKSVNRYNDYK